MPMNDKETTLLSLRVHPRTANKFKVEAARRGVRQNQLFEEMAALFFKDVESTEQKDGERDG